MGKTKAAEPAKAEAKPVEKRLGKRSDVLAIVDKIGKDAFNEIEGTKEEKLKKVVSMFRDTATAEGWSFDTADGTLKQYIDGARSELGWTRERKSSGSGTTGGVSSGGGKSADEPTISDLKNARKLAESLGMDTAKLRELVGKLSAFGSLDKLEASLEALEELMGD